MKPRTPVNRDVSRRRPRLRSFTRGTHGPHHLSAFCSCSGHNLLHACSGELGRERSRRYVHHVLAASEKARHSRNLHHFVRETLVVPACCLGSFSQWTETWHARASSDNKEARRSTLYRCGRQSIHSGNKDNLLFKRRGTRHVCSQRVSRSVEAGATVGPCASWRRARWFRLFGCNGL